jgi:ubiquitin fusion degradation protein 1
MEEEQDDNAKNWEAYLRSQRSRTVFAQYYRCRPMSFLGMDAAAGYDDGNRVVMPQSALDRLGSVVVEYPMVFRIQNAATGQAAHVGVQEFVAEEGFVHVPTHTMARLGLLHNGAHDDGPLVLLTSTSLPKATSVKLQPHTSDFLAVKYPKELLEYNFGRYRCVTVGDTITVAEGDTRYLLDVVEAKPADAVSTVETDCEVDFLPPLDYKEPAPAPWTSQAEFTVGPGEAATVGFRPMEPLGHAGTANGQGDGRFSGVAVRMDGTSVEPPPTVPTAGPSTKWNSFKNALRFGGGASMPATGKGGKKADGGDKDKEATRFTGQKFSLND